MESHLVESCSIFEVFPRNAKFPTFCGVSLLLGVFWLSRLGRQIVSVRAQVEPLGDPHSCMGTQATISTVIILTSVIVCLLCCLLGHFAKMSFYSGILNAKFFDCGCPWQHRELKSCRCDASTCWCQNLFDRNLFSLSLLGRYTHKS
jgi:hypothetical protein